MFLQLFDQLNAMFPASAMVFHFIVVAVLAQLSALGVLVGLPVAYAFRLAGKPRAARNACMSFLIGFLVLTNLPFFLQNPGFLMLNLALFGVLGLVKVFLRYR